MTAAGMPVPQGLHQAPQDACTQYYANNNQINDDILLSSSEHLKVWKRSPAEVVGDNTNPLRKALSVPKLPASVHARHDVRMPSEPGALVRSGLWKIWQQTGNARFAYDAATAASCRYCRRCYDGPEGLFRGRDRQDEGRPRALRAAFKPLTAEGPGRNWWASSKIYEENEGQKPRSTGSPAIGAVPRLSRLCSILGQPRANVYRKMN